MCRHQACTRLHLSSKEIPLQGLQEVWTLYKLCFSKQKPHTKHSAYQITAEGIEKDESEMDEDFCSDDSFILYQVKAVINQAKSKLPKKTHLISNLPYWIKQHQSHHKYLRVCLDTCADVNIMPKSVYQMMFNDPDVKHLADNDISLEVYTDHQVNILGKCQFYMLHPDSKKPLEVTVHVASNKGSVLMFWRDDAVLAWNRLTTCCV